MVIIVANILLPKSHYMTQTSSWTADLFVGAVIDSLLDFCRTCSRECLFFVSFNALVTPDLKEDVLSRSVSTHLNVNPFLVFMLLASFLSKGVCLSNGCR